MASHDGDEDILDIQEYPPGASTAAANNVASLGGDGERNMHLVQLHAGAVSTLQPHHLQLQQQSNASSLTWRRRLSLAFDQAAVMGVAAYQAAPIVEFPEQGDTGAIARDSYDSRPQMEILLGGKLRFWGRNGLPLNSRRYDVIFDVINYGNMPNADNVFDINWRNSNEDYIVELTEEEDRANCMFVKCIGLGLLTCRMCVGPRGGTTTLSYHSSIDGDSQWQQTSMHHIAQGRRRQAAHS